MAIWRYLLARIATVTVGAYDAYGHADTHLALLLGENRAKHTFHMKISSKIHRKGKASII